VFFVSTKWKCYKKYKPISFLSQKWFNVVCMTVYFAYLFVKWYILIFLLSGSLNHHKLWILFLCLLLGRFWNRKFALTFIVEGCFWQKTWRNWYIGDVKTSKIPFHNKWEIPIKTVVKREFLLNNNYRLHRFYYFVVIEKGLTGLKGSLEC